MINRVVAIVYLSSFALVNAATSQGLKEITVNHMSSEMVSISRLFDIYSTYDPDADFDAFLRDNEHLGNVSLDSQIKLSTTFLVPEKTCQVAQADGNLVEAQMWYFTFSMEARALSAPDSPTEIPGDTLLKIYQVRSGRPDATFEEFLRCNSHLGLSSMTDVISYLDEDVDMWAIER